MRAFFISALLLVALLPFSLGVMNFLGGAAAFVPDAQVTPRLDGQMRFSAVWSMLPFFLTLWIVRNLERAGAVLTIVLCATALAGLARLYSAGIYGLPSPWMGAVIAFEIGVLGFIPWYRHVMRA
ncbi:MAG: DUF4345 family protein [Pseudomonadota bacterium]